MPIQIKDEKKNHHYYASDLGINLGTLGDLSKGIVIWMGICTLFGMFFLANMVVRETRAVLGISIVMAVLFRIAIW